jgi:hypothetical protein
MEYWWHDTDRRKVKIQGIHQNSHMSWLWNELGSALQEAGNQLPESWKGGR